MLTALRKCSMNKSESKYFNTAKRMDEALLSLLSEKDFEYVTVKEICDRAKVNRSTFYLHYEDIGDLLLETIQLVSERFRNSYAHQELLVEERPLEKLFFMTDEWLLPYLRFVRENKHVYKAVHANAAAFGVDETFAGYFNDVFSPILSRYGVSKAQHGYIMTFYRYGLTAVIMCWVNHDCAESEESIVEIIKLFFNGQQAFEAGQ